MGLGLEAWIVPYLVEQRELHRFAAQTARNVEVSLRRFCRVAGNRPISRLGPEDVRRFLRDLQPLAATTRYRRFSDLRVWCRWLVDHQVLATDLTKGVEPPRRPETVPRAFQASDLTRALAAPPDARGRAIVVLMYEAGLRCCEVARLELGDWDRYANALLVRGKGAKERVVPILAPAAAVIDAYLDEHPARWGPLIRSYSSPQEPIAAATISKLVSRWFRDAGLKRAAYDGRSAHALRHTSASNMYEASLDLPAVQAFLGHARLDTTAIYQRRAGLGRIRRALEQRSIPLHLAENGQVA